MSDPKLRLIWFRLISDYQRSLITVEREGEYAIPFLPELNSVRFTKPNWLPYQHVPEELLEGSLEAAPASEPKGRAPLCEVLGKGKVAVMVPVRERRVLLVPL